MGKRRYGLQSTEEKITATAKWIDAHFSISSDADSVWTYVIETWPMIDTVEAAHVAAAAIELSKQLPKPVKVESTVEACKRLLAAGWTCELVGYTQPGDWPTWRWTSLDSKVVVLVEGDTPQPPPGH